MLVKRTRFAARRKAVGFSQDQLAEGVKVDRSTVARWEGGETEPQPWVRPRLARVLQVSLEQLDVLLAEASQVGAETDTERLDYTLTHPGNADLVTVAQLRREVQQLDEQYVMVPSSSLLADAGQALGQVRFLAANAANGRVRRELYAVEAEAAILMGQLVWDASQRRDHASARLYFNQAMDVIEQNWGGGGLNIIFGAGKELSPWRSVPVVQDVHDRLLTLMAG
jgi:transcriptional regulator with XRE-family HTH domain